MKESTQRTGVPHGKSVKVGQAKFHSQPLADIGPSTKFIELLHQLAAEHNLVILEAKQENLRLHDQMRRMNELLQVAADRADSQSSQEALEDDFIRAKRSNTHPATISLSSPTLLVSAGANQVRLGSSPRRSSVEDANAEKPEQPGSSPDCSDGSEIEDPFPPSIADKGSIEEVLQVPGSADKVLSPASNDAATLVSQHAEDDQVLGVRVVSAPEQPRVEPSSPKESSPKQGSSRPASPVASPPVVSREASFTPCEIECVDTYGSPLTLPSALTKQQSPPRASARFSEQLLAMADDEDRSPVRSPSCLLRIQSTDSQKKRLSGIGPQAPFSGSEQAQWPSEGPLMDQNEVSHLITRAMSIVERSQTLTVNQSQTPADRQSSSYDTPSGFNLHDVWRDDRVSRYNFKPCVSRITKGMVTHSRSSQHHQSNARNAQDSMCSRCLSRFITHPCSRKRVFWDVLGCIMISYDMIFIPLQTFKLEENTFTSAVLFGSTIFWTLDICMSFLTGFNSEGLMITNPLRIAKRYVRTWLFFDITLVLVDWSLVVAKSLDVSSTVSTGASVGSVMVTVVRCLRVIRLAKLLKIYNGTLSDLLEHVQSEVFIIILNMAKFVILILLLNHLIACFWYSIGSWDEGREDSWVHKFGLEERTKIYRYATALHWSLTQFTPASMEVVPQNEGERVYTICTLVFAMVTFSSFISSITNAMTQLRTINKEKMQCEAQLRRYLGENKVSVAAMGRIWGCLNKAWHRRKNRTKWKDLEVLPLLPTGLKSDLQDEIYGPVLAVHPYFLLIVETFPEQSRRLYQQALDEHSVAIGHEVFSYDDQASQMYWSLSGTLYYHKDQQDTHATMPAACVQSGTWICEPILWVKWKHVGQLVANTRAELVTLKAAKFHEVMEENIHARKYALRFWKYFSEHEIISDLFVDEEMLEDLVIEAERDAEESVQEFSTSHSLHSGVFQRESMQIGKIGGGLFNALARRGSWSSQQHQGTRRPSLHGKDGGKRLDKRGRSASTVGGKNRMSEVSMGRHSEKHSRLTHREMPMKDRLISKLFELKHQTSTMLMGSGRDDVEAPRQSLADRKSGKHARRSTKARRSHKSTVAHVSQAKAISENNDAEFGSDADDFHSITGSVRSLESSSELSG